MVRNNPYTIPKKDAPNKPLFEQLSILHFGLKATTLRNKSGKCTITRGGGGVKEGSLGEGNGSFFPHCRRESVDVSACVAIDHH